jgi:hypothetical protein
MVGLDPPSEFRLMVPGAASPDARNCALPTTASAR